MRKTLLTLALALATPLASSASFSIFGAYWDSDQLGSATGAGLRLGFGLVPTLSLELGGTRLGDFDGEVTLAGVGTAQGRLEVTPLDLGVRFDLGRPGGFYLGGGGSYFLLDSEGSKVDDEVGYYALLGFMLGRKLFVEGVYREVTATFDSIRLDGVVPDLELRPGVDIDLSGISFNVGFRW